MNGSEPYDSAGGRARRLAEPRPAERVKAYDPAEIQQAQPEASRYHGKVEVSKAVTIRNLSMS